MKQIDYGNGSITNAIIRSAGPMMVAQVLSLLYNIIDRMYIAHMPQGTIAIGAVGLCFPILTVLAAFANLYGSGGGPLAAISRGRQEDGEAARIQGASLGMIVITGVILTVIGEVFCTPILRLFGATSGNIPYAQEYLRLVLLGTVFSMVATGMNPFLNAQGRPTAGMLTIATGAILNIVLDPLFIFVLNWGIAGAAIATVLSQVISSLMVMFLLLEKNASLDLNVSIVMTSLKWGRIRRIISLGFAGFIMQVTNSIVQSVSNNLLGQLGGDLYISVMTIVSSVRQILDTPIFGLTDGSSPILSYNYGANKMNRVRKTILIMTGVCLVYTAVIWLCVMCFPQVFISLFNSEASLNEIANPALTMYFFAFVFQAFQYAGQTVFKSLNMRNQAVFFSLFRKVILVVPLTFLLPHWMGVMGVFAAEPISNFIGGSACFICMYFTVYRKLGKDKKDKQPTTLNE